MSSSTISDSYPAANANQGASFMTLVDAAASVFDSKPSQITKPSTVSASATVSISDSSVDGSDCSDKNTMQDPNMDKKLSFAEQLMAILDDEAYADVLHWMPDGKSFTITNPKKFTAEEMPRIFNIRNMSSFVRKLTRWGFSRSHERATMNSDIFKHPQFQKGNYKLCAEIKCTGRTSASSSVSRRPSLESLKGFKMPQQTNAQNSVILPQKMQVTVAPSVPVTRLPVPTENSIYASHNALSSMDPHVLAATVESIRRERELANITRNDQFSNIIGLQRLMEASQNAPSWLTAARAEQLLRLERAQLAGRMAWGGFSSLY